MKVFVVLMHNGYNEGHSVFEDCGYLDLIECNLHRTLEDAKQHVENWYKENFVDEEDEDQEVNGSGIVGWNDGEWYSVAEAPDEEITIQIRCLELA